VQAPIAFRLVATWNCTGSTHLGMMTLFGLSECISKHFLNSSSYNNTLVMGQVSLF